MFRKPYTQIQCYSLPFNFLIHLKYVALSSISVSCHILSLYISFSVIYLYRKLKGQRIILSYKMQGSIKSTSKMLQAVFLGSVRDRKFFFDILKFVEDEGKLFTRQMGHRCQNL